MIWYIWAILGVFAVVFEIATPTFFAIFLGLGFFGSALISYFVQDSLILQIMVALLGMFVGAFVFKKRRIADVPSSKIGQSDEFIGVGGKVIEPISPEKNGRVKLDVPVLGSSEWDAKNIADTTLEKGTLIEIVAIHGHYLDVHSK